MIHLRTQSPKIETAMYMITDIFSGYINNPTSKNEVRYYSYEVKLRFQDRTDYKMHFTFNIDHKKKIIIVTGCSFDDDIKKLPDLQNDT